MNKFAKVNQALNEKYDMLSEYEMTPARDIDEPITVNRLMMINTREGNRLVGVSDEEKKYFFAPVSFIRIVNELLAEDLDTKLEDLIDEPIKVKFEKIHQTRDAKKDYIKTIIC